MIAERVAAFEPWTVTDPRTGARRMIWVELRESVVNLFVEGCAQPVTVGVFGGAAMAVANGSALPRGGYVLVRLVEGEGRHGDQ